MALSVTAKENVRYSVEAFAYFCFLLAVIFALDKPSVVVILTFALFAGAQAYNESFSEKFEFVLGKTIIGGLAGASMMYFATTSEKKS